MYTAAAGKQILGVSNGAIVGLTGGTTYYAIVDPNEPDNLGLSLTPGGMPIALVLAPSVHVGCEYVHRVGCRH